MPYVTYKIQIVYTCKHVTCKYMCCLVIWLIFLVWQPYLFCSFLTYVKKNYDIWHRNCTEPFSLNFYPYLCPFMIFMSMTPKIFLLETSHFTHLVIFLLWMCAWIILTVRKVFSIWQPYLFSFFTCMSITP